MNQKDFEGATLIFLMVAGNDNLPVENGPAFNVQKTPKHLGGNYPKARRQEIITLSLSQCQILSFTSLARTIILSTPLVSNFQDATITAAMTVVFIAVL